MSGEHYLVILQFQSIVQTAEVNPLHERQYWLCTKTALVAMGIDFDAESMRIELKYLYAVITTGIVRCLSLQR